MEIHSVKDDLCLRGETPDGSYVLRGDVHPGKDRHVEFTTMLLQEFPLGRIVWLMDDLDSIELQFLKIVRHRRQIVGDERYMVASAANGADHL